MKSRGFYRLLALLFAFAMVAAACGSDSEGGSSDDTTATTEAVETTEETTATTEADTVIEESDETRAYGGEISIGLESEATGLRPWEDSMSSPALNMAGTIFDRLFEQDIDGNYLPMLATSGEGNEDFTEWTVGLREGVTFHNGVAFSADTIIEAWPIWQVGAISAGQISASNLTAIEKTGDFEVKYILSQPNSAFLAYLQGSGLGMIFEPGAAAADPDGFTNEPVGTGPFVIESRDLDNETVVVRNDSYWGMDPEGNQLPFLDKINFRPIPDEGTRLDSLLSGTVNGMHALRQATIRDARDAGDTIKLFEHQGNNSGGGMYNTLVPPFDDVRVRNGLTLLNAQEQVIDALGGTGISLPTTQYFSADSPWYSETVAAAWPRYDFEAGVAKLTEYVDDPARSDGKAVGEKMDVELSCPPDPSLITAMQVLEQAWTASELVNVTLTNFDQQTHINNALGAPPDFTGSHGAHCWRWSDDVDPSIVMNSEFAPPNSAIAEAAGIPGVVSPLNFSNYFNGDMFTALAGAIRTGSFDERFALYEQANLIIAEETPIWYSGGTATMIAVEPNIFGLNEWHLPSGELGIGFPSAVGRWQEVWVVAS